MEETAERTALALGSGGAPAAPASVTEATMQFSLPAGSNPRDFAVLATDTADLGDRSAIVHATTGFADIVNSGSATTTLGADARVRNVVTRGDLFLRERAHVFGRATIGGGVQRQNSTIIDGFLAEHAATTFESLTVKAAFPAERLAPVDIEPNRMVSIPIAPGYYARLAVKTGSQVTLRSGEYFFDDFQIEPQATIKIDDSSGTVRVHVRNSVDFKGKIARVTAGHPELLLAYFGASSAYFGAPFLGTVVAANGGIDLETVLPTVHEGAFFARRVRVGPDVTVRHRPLSWLLQSIQLDKQVLCSTDSVTVTVDATNPFGAEKPVVSIQGAPGWAQAIQFTGQGRRAITVVASASGIVESRIVFVDLVECGAAAALPVVHVQPNPYHEHGVDFTLQNPEAYEGANYHWEFSDGTSLDTPYPAVTHSFAAGLARDVEFNAFDVTVTAERAGKPDATSTRTITVWNSYAFLKKTRGLIRPLTREVDPDLEVTPQGADAVVSLTNIEDEGFTITSRAVRYDPCDPGSDSIYEPPAVISFAVGAGASANHSVHLSPEALGGACYVSINLSGATASGKPVRTSATFRTAEPVPQPAPDRAQAVLDYVAEHGLTSNPDVITDEELAQLARERRIPLDVLVPPDAPVTTRKAPGAMPIGEPCLPGDTPPQPGVTCQSSWGKEETAEIGNALRGDVVLSKGCGFVSDLMSEVVPAQKWSHTGIMVQNYRTIRQSTGVDAYLENHTNGSLFGEDAPFDGFDEDALRYLWPGTFESSVREAYELGVKVTGPDDEPYKIKGFSYVAKSCAQRNIVYPYVLKPPIEREVELRPTLHQLADAARSIEGHYRFYAYTDATSTAMPSPSEWASSKSAVTVCSSLMWRAAQSLGLEVDADPSDNQNETRADTPDGLYFYREDERRAAAEALYKSVYNRVGEGIDEAADGVVEGALDELGPFGYVVQPLVNLGLETVQITSDTRDDAANQVVNCFASDYCAEGAKDSTRWEDPGTGIAVSPDDLISWDLYETLEPLAYRSARNVRRYTWQRSEDAGAVCGTVTLEGQPVADATVVLSGIEFPAVTDQSGGFRFDPAPAGNYSAVATLFVGDEQSGEQLSAEADLVVVAGEEGECLELALQRPSIEYRRLVIMGSMFVHDEGDENASTSNEAELLLSPTDKEKKWGSLSVCAGDESRGNAYLTARYEGGGAVWITIDMQLHEGYCAFCSACENDDLDGRQVQQVVACDDTTSRADCEAIASSLGLEHYWIVLRDALIPASGTFRVSNDDESSGEYVNLTFFIGNYRQR